jgi:hypothetical protein
MKQLALALTRALPLVLHLGIAATADAQEIRSMAGVDIAMGNFSGNLYYVPDGDAYRVVATVGARDGEMPLRFTAMLVQGQSVVFSVPGKIGEPEHRLKVVRSGDRLFATSEP